jgi:hypothetical protein
MARKIRKERLSDADLKAAGISTRPVVRKVRRPHLDAERVDTLKARARAEGRTRKESR